MKRHFSPAFTAGIITIVVIIGAIALRLATSNPSSSMDTVTSPTPSANPFPEDSKVAKEVILGTSAGDVRLTLFPDDAPLAVRNFVTLGIRGDYTGLTFHRIVPGFVVQGGDPLGTGTGGESIYGEPFATETGDKRFIRGALGMARKAQPRNSNTSQFFITLQEQPSLDGQYTVFGVGADEASLAVVDALGRTKLADPVAGRPETPPTITSFTVTQE